jgi:hypothetical protein
MKASMRCIGLKMLGQFSKLKILFLFLKLFNFFVFCGKDLFTDFFESLAVST